LDLPVLAGAPAFARPPRPPRGVRERIRRAGHRVFLDARERRVARFLRAHRARVLLAEYGPTGCHYRRVCRRLRLPLVVHFHGFDASRLLRQEFYRRAYRPLFREAAAVVVPSHFLAERLRAAGCPPGKLQVHPCGVDLAGRDPVPGEPGRVLAVGRLVAKKGPDRTLRAFARVRERCPRARLRMVGEGPLRPLCEAEIERLGLHGAVDLLGARSEEEVREEFARAALFVQHSQEADDGDCEGLPVGILEAMAAGLPVVSTRHSGIPEAVIAGESGWLVGEGDESGMAEAMLRLLTDPAEAARLGANARQRVAARYTMEQSLAGLRGILEGVAS
jgi:glycosyltransferase involved in cell wall biosynthesis